MKADSGYLFEIQKLKNDISRQEEKCDCGPERNSLQKFRAVSA